MKVQRLKLSPYWWANFWLLFGVMLATEVWFFLLVGEVLLISMVLIALMFLVGALHPWRFLMTMEVREGGYRSFLFGRQCCEIFADRPVYYAVLEFDEHFSIDKTYIAISNCPFWVNPRQTERMPLRSDRFIDYYDRNAVILFPWNEQTEGLFPLEQWHRIN